MTEAEVQKLIRKHYSGKKQSAEAAGLGISETYFSMILRGHRPPCAKMLDALGLDRRVIYIEKVGK
jgi:hypothetical protein